MESHIGSIARGPGWGESRRREASDLAGVESRCELKVRELRSSRTLVLGELLREVAEGPTGGCQIVCVRGGS